MDWSWLYSLPHLLGLGAGGTAGGTTGSATAAAADGFFQTLPLAAILNPQEFLYPEYLRLGLELLPVAAMLLLLGCWLRYRRRRVWAESSLEQRSAASSGRRPLLKDLLQSAVWLFVLALLLVAAAQPVAPDAPDTVRSGTMRIVSECDVSPSMQREDYRGLMPGSPAGSTVAMGDEWKDAQGNRYVSGSRIHMCRYLMGQVMQATRGNSMGIVNYEGLGFPIFEPTTDYTGLNLVVRDEVKAGNAPGAGSNVADGIMVAVQLLKDAAQNDKSGVAKQNVIVIFTDGGFDSSAQDTDAALRAAREINARLILVGLGSTEEGPIPTYDVGTGSFTGYWKLDKGDSTIVDAKLLQALVSAAHAYGISAELYFVPPGKTTLDIQWAKALGGTINVPHGKPLFQYYVGAAAALYGLFILLLGIRWRRTIR